MNLLEEKIKSIDIKLASKSPRRHQLLRNIIKDFEIVSKEIDESYPKSLKSSEIALYLANLKAKSYEKEAKENQLCVPFHAATVRTWDAPVPLDGPLDPGFALDYLA